MEGGGSRDPAHAQDGAARAGEGRRSVRLCSAWPPTCALHCLSVRRSLSSLRSPTAHAACPALRLLCFPALPLMKRQVGTTSVEKSEILAGMLDQEGIPYQVPDLSLFTFGFISFSSFLTLWQAGPGGHPLPGAAGRPLTSVFTFGFIFCLTSRHAGPGGTPLPGAGRQQLHLAAACAPAPARRSAPAAPAGAGMRGGGMLASDAAHPYPCPPPRFSSVQLLNAKPENVERESEIVAQVRTMPHPCCAAPAQLCDVAPQQLAQSSPAPTPLHHCPPARSAPQSGRRGAVTIATNMAGRGTDILLGGNPGAPATAVGTCCGHSSDR